MHNLSRSKGFKWENTIGSKNGYTFTHLLKNLLMRNILLLWYIMYYQNIYIHNQMTTSEEY